MNWYPQLYTDLESVIAQAWPDVTKVFRITQIQRVHWLNEILAGKLTPPWSTLEIPAVPREPGWGPANIVYKPQVTINYIGRTQDFRNQGLDSGAFLEALMTSMQQIILTQAFESFQYVDQSIFTFDNSEQNPIYRSLLEAKIPYFACSVSFAVLTGYIANT